MILTARLINADFPAVDFITSGLPRPDSLAMCTLEAEAEELTTYGVKLPACVRLSARISGTAHVQCSPRVCDFAEAYHGNFPGSIHFARTT